MKAQDLKNSILQLAVQGKLVPQDPADEPASILLAKIRAEKEKLIKAGKLKKEKNPSEIIVDSDGIPYEKFSDGKIVDISDEIPFPIPPTWQWVRLNQLGEIVGGGTPSTSNPSYWENGDIPWISPSDLTGYLGKYISIGKKNITSKGLCNSSARLMPAMSLLYSSRAPIGYIVIASNTITTNQGFKSLVPTITLLSEFYFYALQALTADIKQRATGTTFKEISGSEFGKTLVPLPPIAEQQRIVAKIEELLPHIERYGKAEAELDELQKRFPEELKKSILQSAIQGKLVPQDLTDESAEVLLERIRAEKSRLIKSGKLKPPKNESTIFRASDRLHYEKCGTETRCIEDELPFQIPDSWQWVRLGEIATIIRGSGIKRDEVSSTGVQCVRYGEVYTTYDVAFVNAVSHVPSQIAEKCKHIKSGDVLCTLTGESKNEIGKSTAYLGNGDVVIGGDLATITDHHCEPMYLAYFMYSPFAITQKAKLSNGDIIVHISGEKLKNILLPFPPIAEQKRIVAQIEKLLCYKKELSG